jgi:hypothetical protein
VFPQQLRTDVVELLDGAQVPCAVVNTLSAADASSAGEVAMGMVRRGRAK